MVRSEAAKYKMIEVINASETTGTVVLSLYRETAIKIVSKFASAKYTTLTYSILGGFGDLINIVAGNTIQGLEDFKIVISLPGVITGS